MKYYYLTGYVVHRMALGEADKIITLFSKEIGKTRLVAKGIRRSKARLSGYMEPFNEISLRLTKAKNLDLIIGASTVTAFNLPPQKESMLVTAYYMNELISKLLADEQTNIKVYELYTECLEGLVNKVSPNLVRHYFAMQFLQAIGLQPDLAQATDLAKNYFVYNNSSIVDSRPNKHYGLISVNTIKLWRLIQHNSLIDVKNIKNINKSLLEGEKLLNNYYEYHFDFLPKSLKVFQDNTL